MASQGRGAKKTSRGRASKGGGGKDGGPPRPTDKEGRLSVLIEVRGGPGASGAQAMSAANSFEVSGLKVDQEFAPVPMSSSGDGMDAGPTYMIRGTVKTEAELEDLKKRPEVVAVWPDTPIDGFAK